MSLTIDKVRDLTTDDHAIELVANVLKKTTAAIYTKARVDEYIRPIFDRFDFRVTKMTRSSQEGDPITDPKHLYLDTDDEKAEMYFAACRVEHLKNEFAAVVKQHERKNGDQGYCPALIAEHDLVEAERKLAEYAVGFLGMPESAAEYPARGKLQEILIPAICTGPRGKEVI